MIPRVLLFQAKTSGEEDAGEGQQECNDALRVGGVGVGILEPHCPISIVKPHPSRGPCQRRQPGILGQIEAEASKHCL